MKKSQVEVESRVIRGAHGVAAEEDHILTGQVIQVGVIALVIFIAGGIWAWRLQVATTDEFVPDGPAPIPALITPDAQHRTAYEIGIVNQRLFDQDTHAEEKLHAQQEALDNGWVDTPGKAVRPTISQAMDQVIANQAAARQAPRPPPPAPAPTPAPQAPQRTAPTAPTPAPQQPAPGK